MKVKPVVLAVLLAAAPAARAQDASEPRRTGIEPKIQRIVIEDKLARIEELRVRGQTQRITVQPKQGGVKPYEILPPTEGRDMSDSAGPQRGAAGQRVWHVMSF